MLCSPVSGLVQNLVMPTHKRKYRVTRRFTLDFEFFVCARDEDEAVLEADSEDIESWNDFDSSWEIMEVTQINHLVLVEPNNEPEIVRPVIKIWERIKAQSI